MTKRFEERWQRECARYRDFRAAEDRLRGLIPQALDVLAEALTDKADTKGRVAVALAVLRAAGLHGLPAPEKPHWASLQHEDDWGE